ncbi:hypothetical protein KCP71_22600 [Salmonella enterica subsp. enterica]|nr:hypothetical protein KCP71_22600 [Salmonella enterica subsp. enterica]
MAKARGWLNRIKIAPQNATASVNVAVRLSLNMMLRYHGVDEAVSLCLIAHVAYGRGYGAMDALLLSSVR